MFRWISLLFIKIILLLIISCSASFEEKNLVKTVTKENSQFSITLKSFKQNPTIGLAGIDYLIETKTTKNNVWRQLFVVSHDDGIDFSDKNIIFPTSEVGFVFLIKKYSVTLDQGENWKILEIKNTDPSCLIKNVIISADGKGTMSLNCNKKRVDLFTFNFGVDWKE